MSIKIKLLLYFLCLSFLIIATGTIFYFQFKNLIEPLTPQSIPKSIEKLVGSIEADNMVYHLLYQQQLVQSNLSNYVLTKQTHFMQDYYMNEALMRQMVADIKESYPEFWLALSKQLNAVSGMREKIIYLTQINNDGAARQLLSGHEMATFRDNMIDIINNHYLNFDISTNESDVVTLKLASKNTIKILFNSMNTTIIIFLNVLAISLLFALYSAKAISNPINLLKKDMDHITSRNIDAPIRKDLVTHKGEVGDLARSFVALIERLRATTVSRDKLLLEIDLRIKTEEELRELAQRLEESNRELDQFAYSASHDLRTPLRGILNLADWVMEDCKSILPKESQQHLELLKGRTLRLDKLINGILEYSRAGRTPATKEIVDLNMLLFEVIDSLSPPPHIQITIDMQMPILTTYAPLLNQVFLNLINNAIKFLDKPKGQVHIGYELEVDQYKFYVRDDGPGIDPQFHTKIFDIFSTLQSRDSVETAGIGLALVKKNVESQGGNVWVDSGEGKGSTFYFTWPRS